ncbi:MAG: ABC transporter ATP-binding protein [Bacillota bacterium]|nr:ABC transporter ATP-binding protein [Bacillota bacterium]
MNKAIDIKNLVKRYDSKTALDDVSFSVSSGSCFGLLGPNGAGKSTAMKILTGIIEYDSGSVDVLGFDLKSQKDDIRTLVGYVPQEITLYEKLSAYNNLRFFGELYGIKGRELKKRIDDVLEQVGLTDHANSLINTFSGGMKRRINIAAALLHKPRLLILDEPTVGIDPQSRNHIFGMIRALKKDGITVIYSTHYMEEVESLCDEIAIIDHGRVIAKGDLNKILDKHAVNAVYVESEQMSKIPVFEYSGKVSKKDRGWVIETSNILGTIQDITKKAMELNMAVKELEIVRPNLETVFLSLTGTSLRD